MPVGGILGFEQSHLKDQSFAFTRFTVDLGLPALRLSCSLHAAGCLPSSTCSACCGSVVQPLWCVSPLEISGSPGTVLWWLQSPRGPKVELKLLPARSWWSVQNPKLPSSSGHRCRLSSAVRSSESSGQTWGFSFPICPWGRVRPSLRPGSPRLQVLCDLSTWRTSCKGSLETMALGPEVPFLSVSWRLDSLSSLASGALMSLAALSSHSPHPSLPLGYHSLPSRASCPALARSATPPGWPGSVEMPFSRGEAFCRAQTQPLCPRPALQLLILCP